MYNIVYYYCSVAYYTWLSEHFDEHGRARCSTRHAYWFGITLIFPTWNSSLVLFAVTWVHRKYWSLSSFAEWFAASYVSASPQVLVCTGVLHFDNVGPSGELHYKTTGFIFSKWKGLRCMHLSTPHFIADTCSSFTERLAGSLFSLLITGPCVTVMLNLDNLMLIHNHKHVGHHNHRRVIKLVVHTVEQGHINIINWILIIYQLWYVYKII